MLGLEKAARLSLLALGIATSVSAGAVNQARVNSIERNLARAMQSDSLEADGCEACLRAQTGDRPSPLLQNVYMNGVGRNGDVWDYRQQHRPSTLGPLRAVGRVIMQNDKQTYLATASLVSPCHILTSAHVASDLMKRKDWQSIEFRIGDNDAPVRARRIPNASGNPKGTLGICNQDWEVLRLDKCVGDQFGYLPLKPLPVDQFEDVDVVSAGFPANISPKKGITIDPVCEMEEAQELSFLNGTKASISLTSCALDSGNSGGPIVTRTAYPEVIALSCSTLSLTEKRELPFQQRYTDIPRGVANLVTPIAPNFDRIIDILTSPSELEYVAQNSKLPPPDYRQNGTAAGPWQKPGSGVPEMPILDRVGRPPNWHGMSNPSDHLIISH